MSIIINGTSGISGVDGSAATPALQGSDTNTGISFGADTVNLITGGVTRATTDASGYFRLSGSGIQFNGDTAAANSLDDYEEGTFTPYFSSSGATVPGTSDIFTAYTRQNGKYQKIGNRVSFEVFIETGSAFSYQNGGTTGQSLYIAGFPFNTENITYRYGGAVCSSYYLYGFDAYTYGFTPMGVMQINAAYLALLYPAGTAASAILTTNVEAANRYIAYSGFYFVS